MMGCPASCSAGHAPGPWRADGIGHGTIRGRQKFEFAGSFEPSSPAEPTGRWRVTPGAGGPFLYSGARSVRSGRRNTA